ncbi:superoxide dismutase [Lentzea aerocolonigenes]|uniref:superoxide dismutase n=1 Tax=Lentzea aerocolonigenes TaxID=68170 RepID=UPI0004C3C0E8|nr:superoxide dismutase [Lentzea aerocolonigenes]MCP2246393.1 superoxide dismutase, Fe-Mn family [Lentzea aerocolonigenes]
MSQYVLPDLPYDYAALEPAITGEILELHHSKHHAAYVKGANDMLERLAETREKEDFSGIVGLEKTFAFNLSGHVLHTMFWDNLSPEGGDRPDGELAAAIDEHFGSFEAFSKQLTAATSLVQGSGWGVLAWEPLSQRLIVEQVYDHHGNVGMNTTPVLVFDAWEHAYYLQYRNVRPDYVQKLWSLVNWADVTRRFDAARAGNGGLIAPSK